VKQSSLEPGLVQIFRLFVGGRLALLSLSLLGKLTQPLPLVLRFPFLGILETLFLLGYLSWPWLQRQMGRAYLSFALLIASSAPILEAAFAMVVRLARGVSGANAISDVWQLILVLFIPLILTSWQYSFRSVLTFSLGTALLELGIMVLIRLRLPFPIMNIVRLVLIRTVLFVLVGYVIVRLVKEQRAQRQALAQANAQLTRYATTLEQLAVSRERNRLARELHDTLAHSLSAVAVQLEATNALWDQDLTAARDMLEQSLQATRRGLSEARRAIQALRATPLEDLGLALAIRNLAESAANRGGLTLHWQGDDQVNILEPDVEQSVYRIAEEALVNVVRHAGARHLTVQLDQERGQSNRALRLVISDDGQGFDMSRPSQEGRYGLKGMIERAALIGGALAVESEPGAGTTVRLVVEDKE
jgi:signal transduction histidine kinase